MNKSHEQNTTPKDDEPMILTPLTDIELKMLSGGMSPISTITWFQGDHREAAAILRDRVQAIVHKNPWLAGRILRRNKSEYLAYNTNVFMGDDESAASAIQSMFGHITEYIAQIDRTTNVAKIAKMLTESKIMLRARCDRVQPLWKVIVLPCSRDPTNCFAVIVSMSHIAGDGATFYSLHNALMGTSIIPELVPDRIETTIQQQEDALGAAELNFYHMPGFILTILWGAFLTKLIAPTWFGKHLRVQNHCYLLNMEQMKAIKNEFLVTDTIVPFVSTNDVLTSWFFQNSQCQIGRMAINFRNRLKGHTDAHAGNYENALFYRVPEDTVSPTLIRQSVSNLKRAVTASQPPTNNELWTANISLISNWASFAAKSNPSLGGARQQVHLPLFDAASLVPTTLAVCIIFEARPNELGVMFMGTQERISGLLQDTSFLSGSLS